MAGEEQLVVVAYDIRDDRRRNRVHAILRDFGLWMQYSVFECRLTPAQLVRLHHRLRREVDPNEDRVFFYLLCGSCLERVKRIGSGDPYDIVRYIV